MATQEITVEIAGDPGQTAAYAYIRTGGDGTGVADSVAAVEDPAGTGKYVVTIQWDDATASNKPIGEWMVGVGTQAVSYGESAVVFDPTETWYPIGSLTKAQAQAAVVAGIAASGPVINSTNPVSAGSTLTVVEGNTYDGTRHTKPSWTTGKDYTDGWTAKLRIFSIVRNENVKHGEFVADIESPTLITCSFDAVLVDVDYRDDKSVKAFYSLIVSKDGKHESAVESPKPLNCVIVRRET